MDDKKPEKLKRYFTQADYEAGLCDKNGLPIEGGPAEPAKRSPRDSVPTSAQKALNPENTAVDPAPLAADPAFDPQKVDAKPAETGMNVEVPED